MPQTFDHLHPGVWSFLDESQEERITRLYMPKWVSYEGASEALARMEHLLRHPPCGRMPSMLLYGDSDTGKSQVAQVLRLMVGDRNTCQIGIDRMDDPKQLAPIVGKMPAECRGVWR